MNMKTESGGAKLQFTPLVSQKKIECRVQKTEHLPVTPYGVQTYTARCHNDAVRHRYAVYS